jgi:hypothetical protein
MVSVAPLDDGVLCDVFQGVRLFYDALFLIFRIGGALRLFSFMP